MTAGRRLLHLAGAAAATLLLALAAGLAGPAGVLLNLLIPLPVAYVGMRAGVASALGAAVLSLAGLTLAGGLVGGGSYLLQFGIGSVLLPLLLRRGWNWDRAAAATVLVVLAAVTVALVGYAQWRGSELQSLVEGYVQGEVKQAMQMYQAEDQSPEMAKEFQSIAEQTGQFLTRAYPGLATVVLMVIQGVTLLFLNALSRGRYSIPGAGFRQWRAPEWLIWGLIAAGFGLAFAPGVMQRGALNLLTVLLPLYFLQGLAVISFFFARRGVSPLFRALGYLLIVVFNPLPLIVTGIGVFDLWVDFRKPRLKKT